MHQKDSGKATVERETTEGSFLLSRFAIPTALSGLALALMGGDRIEPAAAERPHQGAMVSSAGSLGFITALSTEMPKAFDASERMQKILSNFGDSLERKLLIVTLTPEQKSQLAEHADSFMRANPPADFDAHVKWQRHLFVLRACDPCLAAGYDRAEDESLKAVLDSLDRWKKNEAGLPALDRDMRKLHMLVSALSPESQSACSAKMTSIEGELMKDAKLVGDYLDSCLNVSRRRGIEERKAAEDAISRGSRIPVLKYIATATIHSELEGCADFKCDGGRWYFCEKLGEGKQSRWLVELDSMYLHLHGRHVTLRAEGKPGMFVAMSESEFRGAVGKGKIDPMVKEARRTAELEEKHAETLKGYDFPKQGKMAYLRVFPDSHDQVISATLQSSMLLSAALKHRYGERMDVIEPVFTSSPREAMIKAIEKARPEGKGPSFFYLDVYNHGSPQAVAFDYAIYAQDIAAIAKRFPECKFAFSTIACYGGGLREGWLKEVEKDPSLKDRVALFVQTKPNMPNYLASTSQSFGDPPYNSTNCYLHLTRALYDPKCATFGEAFRIGDLKTKEFMSLDAECVIDGQLIGRAGAPSEGQSVTA